MSDAPLFENMPEQQAPTRRDMGGKAIERCPKCKGRRRQSYSYYSGGYTAERGYEPCERCAGSGWVAASS